MRSVLGIDAAWTLTEPSGVALVVERESGWQCEAVAPSYNEFIALTSDTPVRWTEKSRAGLAPNVPQLLEAAEHFSGAPVDLIAIDMPMAKKPIKTRRPADNEVSKEFGTRWCATHSPSEYRPGPMGKQFTEDFLVAGYPLATSLTLTPQRSLIEVYPHTALLSLLKDRKDDKRVPYKVGKSRTYWKTEDVPTRIKLLLHELAAIKAGLEMSIRSIPFDLPAHETVTHFSSLKPYEDALDALVCAWVGIEHLLGRTSPMGDGDAAIWCPTDVIHGRNKP